MASLWGEILQSESDVKLKTFIRHYWISHHGDIKTQSLYREIRDSVLEHDIESLELSRSLRDSSLVYRDILSGHDDDPNVSKQLADLNTLGAAVMYPVTLSACETIGDKAQLARFLRAIVVTYVRHNVISRLENSLLEDVVFELAKNLRDGMAVSAATEALQQFAPDDDDFAESFWTAVTPDRSTARYLLTEIELSRRATEELQVAVPPKVHVEHIYPQTPQAGQRWQDRVRLLNRLGNLTLLSGRLNTGIRNGSFDQKKSAYAQSELLITQELNNYQQWTPETIDERQLVLAERAATIWAFAE